LVDVPAFDFPGRGRDEVLEELIFWLLKAYESGVKLTGLVYMHRIDSNKMFGSDMSALRIFKKLCGTQNYPAIVMATSGWNKIQRQTGESRVQELIQKDFFWGDLYNGGAQVEPFYHEDRRSALRIINLLLGHAAGTTLAIQTQMIEENRSLHETDAGQEMYCNWLREKDQLECDKAEYMRSFQDQVDGLYDTSIASLETQMQKVNAKLERGRRSRRDHVTVVWEIRMRDDFRMISDELSRSQLKLQRMELAFDALSADLEQGQKPSKEFQRELAIMRRRVLYLQKTKMNRADTYRVAIVGVKIAATAAAAIVPAVACTIM
jgi:hypothetical protein